MDRQNHSVFRFITERGYTLVEMLVVLAIMAFIAVLGIYALRSQDRSQIVITAQRDFLSNIRSVQNNVRNGVNGVAVASVVMTTGDVGYTIVNSSSPLSTRTVSLPQGVTLSFTGGPVGICMVNSNLVAYTATAKCVSVASGASACTSGVGYLCNVTTVSAPAYLDINFTNGIVTKTVRVEGQGMNIGRIYATN